MRNPAALLATQLGKQCRVVCPFTFLTSTMWKGNNLGHPSNIQSSAHRLVRSGCEAVCPARCTDGFRARCRDGCLVRYGAGCIDTGAAFAVAHEPAVVQILQVVFILYLILLCFGFLCVQALKNAGVASCEGRCAAAGWKAESEGGRDLRRVPLRLRRLQSGIYGPGGW